MAIDLNTLDLSTANPEDLAQAFAELEQGDTPAATEAEQQPEVKDEEKQAEQPKQEAEQPAQQEEDQSEQDPDGVATKDGKHVIPYSVLQSERERAKRAEQMLVEMQERVNKLESIAASAASANQGAKPGESARTEGELQADALSEEDLDALKEDFPTVYKAMMAQKQMIAALESKVVPVQERMRASEEAAQRTEAQQIQDAIDANPKLAFIQSSDVEAFELAKQFDAGLSRSAAWRDKPLSERFAKVTEMVEAAQGVIQMPDAKTPAKQPSAEELKAAAKAKVATTAAKPVPNSLSQFPAGEHAAQDATEALEQMTSAQLADKFARMTPDQMDAYFQNI